MSRRTAAVVAVLGVVGLVVLFAFDPSTAGFFPPCPIFALTGLQCSGCGVLRGTHALLHGDVAAAWRLNPLWVALLPLLLGLLGWEGARTVGVPLTPAKVPRILWWGMLVVVISFGVIRNL